MQLSRSDGSCTMVGDWINGCTICNGIGQQGQSPQICTVSHGRTFEYQNFSNFRYAIFQYTSFHLSFSLYVMFNRCPAMRFKTKVCFSATNRPHNQNFSTKCINIITNKYPITFQDSFNHFYPPTGHVRP